MKGVVFHTSASTMAQKALVASASHATCGEATSPSRYSRSPMTPESALKIQRQAMAMTAVGSAQGIRTAARTRPRPGNGDHSTSAMARPRTSSRTTVTAVRLKVVRTTGQNRVSTARRWYSPARPKV